MREGVTYTFANGASGVIHRVSQFTLASLEIAMSKKHPKPKPPLAPGVGGMMEPNPADPEYVEALGRWQNEQQIRILDALLDLAIEIEVNTAELEHVKATFAALGADLDEINDKVAYIKHCCILDLARELPAIARIIRGDIPTEEDVRAHVETFRSDVEKP